MIKQVNQNVQKTFKIGKPNFLKVPKSQNFDKLESKYLGRLNKLQRQYGLSDKDTLGEYHEAYWREYVFNDSKQFGVKLKPENQFGKLIRRWKRILINHTRYKKLEEILVRMKSS